MKNINKLFANRIKALRKIKNLAQEQLGAKSGISYKYIGEIEREETNPSLDVIGKIADGFGIPLKDLMDFPDKKKSTRKEDILISLSKCEIDTVKKAL